MIAVLIALVVSVRQVKYMASFKHAKVHSMHSPIMRMPHHVHINPARRAALARVDPDISLRRNQDQMERILFKIMEGRGFGAACIQ